MATCAVIRPPGPLRRFARVVGDGEVKEAPLVLIASSTFDERVLGLECEVLQRRRPIGHAHAVADWVSSGIRSVGSRAKPSSPDIRGRLLVGARSPNLSASVLGSPSQTVWGGGESGSGAIVAARADRPCAVNPGGLKLGPGDAARCAAGDRPCCSPVPRTGAGVWFRDAPRPRRSARRRRCRAAGPFRATPAVGQCVVVAVSDSGF